MARKSDDIEVELLDPAQAISSLENAYVTQVVGNVAIEEPKSVKKTKAPSFKSSGGFRLNFSSKAFDNNRPFNITATLDKIKADALNLAKGHTYYQKLFNVLANFADTYGEQSVRVSGKFKRAEKNPNADNSPGKSKAPRTEVEGMRLSFDASRIDITRTDKAREFEFEPNGTSMRFKIRIAPNTILKPHLWEVAAKRSGEKRFTYIDTKKLTTKSGGKSQMGLLFDEAKMTLPSDVSTRIQTPQQLIMALLFVGGADADAAKTTSQKAARDSFLKKLNA